MIPQITREEDWREKAAKKRADLAAAIPSEWRLPAALLETLSKPLETSPTNLLTLDVIRRSGVLSEREFDITTNYDTRRLLSKLATGEFSAFEVTVAFSKRAAIAQQLIGCLTETFFERAQQRAKELDELRKTENRILGPLHGLPISVKEPLSIAGSPSTLGLVHLLDERAESNSSMVELLTKMGAIIYTRTNISQIMMTADSHNNIFGRTLNPWNTSLTAGGSSGGEGALIAMRGSMIGIGTDIAGSIRIPALCCGTYGFKPTANRLPAGGQQSASDPGLKFIPGVVGPLAHDLESLSFFTESMIRESPYITDWTAYNLPWRPLDDSQGSVTRRKLRIGVVPEDAAAPLHPPVKRLLAETARLMQEEGHEIIKLKSDECNVGLTTVLAWNFFGLDGKAMTALKTSGEPLTPSLIQSNEEFKKLAAQFSTQIGDIAGMPPGLGKLSKLNSLRADITRTWANNWNTYKLDAVIAPPAQNGAVPHDTFGMPPYTVFLNVLDYPACVIPVKNSSQFFLPDDESPEMVTGPPYDPKVLSGAPLGVQIFTDRFQDEECLAISKRIDDCLRQAGVI